MLHYNEKKTPIAKDECVKTLKGLQQLVANRNLSLEVNRNNPTMHRIRVVDEDNRVLCEGTMALTASKHAYKESDVKSAERMLKSLNSSLIGDVASKIGDIFNGGDSSEDTNASAECEAPTDEPPVDLDADADGVGEVSKDVVDGVIEIAKSYLCEVSGGGTEYVDDIPVEVVIVTPEKGSEEAWDDYNVRSRRDTEDDWAEQPEHTTEDDIRAMRHEIISYCSQNNVDVEFEERYGEIYITLSNEIYED